MKTRELLTCDVHVFGRKIQGLKLKELERHIERICGDLGVKDSEALIDGVIAAVLDEQDLPEDGGEEMRRVLEVLESHILLTQDNEDTALRLVALMVAYLRAAVRRAARDQRLEARATGASGHHHDHACEDPECDDPEHHHPHH